MQALFQLREQLISIQIPTDQTKIQKIIDLLELGITNYFKFNGEMYQQVCCCAMGKRFSPYFAEWEYAC